MEVGADMLFDEDSGAVLGLEEELLPEDGVGRAMSADAEYSCLYLKRYSSSRGPRRNLIRYFGQGAECSDDGHPARWTAHGLCAICLATTHQMRACPESRCGMCFLTGHVAFECSQALKRAELEDVLIAGFSDALAADESVRCIVCGKSGAGHKNCAPVPEPSQDQELAEEGIQEQDLLEEEEAVEDDEEDDDVLLLDEVGSPFACWSEPVSSGAGAGIGWNGGDAAGGLPDTGIHTNHLCNALGSTILRLLAEAIACRSTDSSSFREETWQKRLASTALAALARAARDLWRIGAIVPASLGDVRPSLTPLGSWLAPLPLPPSIAGALVHGALWGVLLPMAVIIVLLESAPPDLALQDGVDAPRRSDHFALATSYFRWREGRQTDASRRLGSDLFWETVDQRIVAVCKHAQQALGYDGDDAAFEEMDGELMDVRRRDGRPWTVASALGGEASERWARLRAAVCAAFPPQALAGSKTSKLGQGTAWVARTSLGDGTAKLDTAVSSAYALVFAAGELRPVGGAPFEVEVAGVRGTLCGGDGACEEAEALRTEYKERVAQAVEGVEEGRGTLTTMDVGFTGQVLHYLRDSAGEITCLSRTPSFSKQLARGAHSIKDGVAAANHEEQEDRGNVAELEETVMSFLGRHVDEVSGHGPRTSLPLGKAEQGVATASQRRPQQGVCRWGEWREANAAQGNDDSLAHSDEEMTVDSVERQEWLSALAHAALLQCLKRRAVSNEDYCLAAKLKAHEAQVKEAVKTARSRAMTVLTQQRERTMQALASRKRKAVEDEDYHLAARLKKRQQVLEAQPGPPSGSDELERVRAEKSAAVAAEDFDRAAALRERQSALEAELTHFDALVARQAAEWADDGLRRSSGASLCWAVAAREADWAEAAMQLRSESSG